MTPPARAHPLVLVSIVVALLFVAALRDPGLDGKKLSSSSSRKLRFFQSRITGSNSGRLVADQNDFIQGSGSGTGDGDFVIDSDLLDLINVRPSNANDTKGAAGTFNGSLGIQSSTDTGARSNGTRTTSVAEGESRGGGFMNGGYETWYTVDNQGGEEGSPDAIEGQALSSQYAESGSGGDSVANCTTENEGNGSGCNAASSIDVKAQSVAATVASSGPLGTTASGVAGSRFDTRTSAIGSYDAIGRTGEAAGSARGEGQLGTRNSGLGFNRWEREP